MLLLLAVSRFGLAIGAAATHHVAMHNNSGQTVERTLIEAIASKRLVAARYNGNQMLLAPHQLFSRHGALFVSAVNTERNWRADEERRLGQYRLAGLSDVALRKDSFEPVPGFDGRPHREGDENLFAI